MDDDDDGSVIKAVDHIFVSQPLMTAGTTSGHYCICVPGTGAVKVQVKSAPSKRPSVRIVVPCPATRNEAFVQSFLGAKDPGSEKAKERKFQGVNCRESYW